MNYEQKYKEALERARDLMTNQNPPAFDKDLISIVFPELAESEDERIRKVLIDYFNEYKKVGTCGSIMFNGIPTGNIIAWLEKQGDTNEMLADWNEEDKQIILSIEQVMNCASLLNLVPEKIDNIKSWLKSIRPQKQGKPTEKQGENKLD